MRFGRFDDHAGEDVIRRVWVDGRVLDGTLVPPAPAGAEVEVSADIGWR